jgi:hypothetical protein
MLALAAGTGVPTFGGRRSEGPSALVGVLPSNQGTGIGDTRCALPWGKEGILL